MRFSLFQLMALPMLVAGLLGIGMSVSQIAEQPEPAEVCGGTLWPAGGGLLLAMRSGSEFQVVRHDLRSGTQQVMARRHLPPAGSVSVSADLGTYVVQSSEGRPSFGRLVRGLRTSTDRHAGAPRQMVCPTYSTFGQKRAISADGSSLVAADGDTVSVWPSDQKAQPARIVLPGTASCVEISPRGTFFAAAVRSAGLIEIRELPSGRLLEQVPATVEHLSTVFWDHGEDAVLWTADGHIYGYRLGGDAQWVYEIPTYRRAPRLSTLSASDTPLAMVCAVSVGGEMIATGTSFLPAPWLGVIDTSSHNVLWQGCWPLILNTKSPLRVVQFSDDGRTLLFAAPLDKPGSGARAGVLDLETGDVRCFTVPFHRDRRFAYTTLMISTGVVLLALSLLRSRWARVMRERAVSSTSAPAEITTTGQPGCSIPQ